MAWQKGYGESREIFGYENDPFRWKFRKTYLAGLYRMDLRGRKIGGQEMGQEATTAI